MKILMLNSEYPPLGGGQGSANKSLYEELQDSDLQIDIITASVDQQKIERSTIGSIHYLDISKKNKDIHHQSIKHLLIYSWKALWTAFRLHKQQKYDLIVAWSGVPAGFLGIVFKFFTNTKCLILLRGSDVPFHEKKWFLLDKYFLSWFSPHFIWKYADAVFANSEMLKKKALQSKQNQTIGVIYNGVDISKFQFSPKKNIPQTLTLISTGRLSLIKGYDFLIQAMEGLPNICLKLIGDGTEYNNLKKLAEKLGVNVAFVGNQPHHKIKQFLQQADIFVLPSLNEGMSNSLLEALACGLPIIATDVGGTKELVKENINGFVIEKESVEQIRNAIQKYLQNPNLLAEFGEESRLQAEKMSIKQIATQYVQLFKSLKK